MKGLFSAVILAGFLAGCATVGNLAIQDKTKVEQIKVGITTKAQVQELIGSPTTASFAANGLETWHYIVTHASANPAAFVPLVGLLAHKHNIESTSLILMFGDDGIVKKIAYTEPTAPKESPETKSATPEPAVPQNSP